MKGLDFSAPRPVIIHDFFRAEVKKLPHLPPQEAHVNLKHEAASRNEET